jgi:DUF4097 and DUF4098 domain-containing protein YvlB
MKRAFNLICVVFVGLVSLPLQAAEQPYVKRGTPERHGRAWIERSEISAPVREGGRLILRVDAGSVALKPGASDHLEGQVVLRAYTGSEAEARRIFGNYQLSARTLENGGVYVTARLEGGRHNHMSFGADFQIKLPQRFILDVETEGGDIGVESVLQGEARLTTAGGDIHTADVSGALKAETAGGNITLGQMGQRVDARTAGGGIRVGDVKGDATLETSGGEIVVGQIAGALRAETAGGDVVIAGAAGPVVAETAGGQIQIGPAGGSVRAETAGGSIRCQGTRGRLVAETSGGSIDLIQVEGPVNASTAAGRILAQWTVGQKNFGASQLETSMGDVYVYLPPNLPLNIDAAIDAAAGHKILSDFPLTILGDKEEFVARSISGRGTLNGGGETLRIRTTAGNIEIRKIDARTMEELKSREESTWQRWEQRRTERERRRLEHEQERREHQRDRDKEGDPDEDPE